MDWDEVPPTLTPQEVPHFVWMTNIYIEPTTRVIQVPPKECEGGGEEVEKDATGWG